MNKEELKFISKMILDEVMELLATAHPAQDAKNLLKSLIDESEDLPQEQYSGSEQEQTIGRCADQADAMVDVYYYMLNAAAKKGMNLSSVFRIVHGANMAKRDPETGEFRKRASDGKILKPAGWTPPDINAEMRRQFEQGSFPVPTAGGSENKSDNA